MNLEAYQNYLMGQYYRARLTLESLTKAKESFERALTIDPNYSAAHSGLALYYMTLATAFIKPLAEIAVPARSAAQKALAIDPSNAEAHSVLGVVAGIFDGDWESAGRHHRMAMAVEPVAPWVLFRYALWYLLPLRRFVDAKEQCRLALERDPVSMALHFCMAWSMYAAREYPEAIEYARSAMEIDANFYLIWGAMGVAQLGIGGTQEAIASFQRVLELAPLYFPVRVLLAAAYYRTGDRERSRQSLETLSGWQLGLGEVFYYATIGEEDAPFEALERSYQRRDYLTLYPPLFDPYRADQRFQNTLHQMHLA